MEQEIRLNWESAEQLIPVCIEFYKQHKAKEEIDLYDAANKVAAAFGINDLEKFALGKVENGLHEGFAGAMDDDLAKALAKVFAGACKPVMSSVMKYTKGEISKKTFINSLNQTCWGNSAQIQGILENALHVPSEASTALAEKCGPYLVSIYCFAAAFKIYQKAANDAALAKERRIEVERFANEAIARLEAQRREFEEFLDKYLLSYLQPFQESLDALDQAVLDNDDDGYIAANAELWALFGRKAQYETAQEFDDLMLSDEVFKL